MYCNYYFFVLCWNLLFFGMSILVKHLLRHRVRVVFPRIGPCLFRHTWSIHRERVPVFKNEHIWTQCTCVTLLSMCLSVAQLV